MKIYIVRLDKTLKAMLGKMFKTYDLSKVTYKVTQRWNPNMNNDIFPEISLEDKWQK